MALLTSGQSIDISRDVSFELLERIGKGGMGEVWRARRHGSLSRVVALKFVLPEMLVQGEDDEEEDVEMRLSAFRDEAKLVAALPEIPNIVRVHGAYDWDGSIIQELSYIDGVSLRQVFEKVHQEKQALQPLFGVAMGARLAKALYRIHTARSPLDGSYMHVVHRDISPSNIMLAEGAGPVLIDFGVAYSNLPDREAMTRVPMLKGKANYMPPEQARHLQVTAASDQYALALVIYETVLGVQFYVRSELDGDTASFVATKLNDAYVNDRLLVMEKAGGHPKADGQPTKAQLLSAVLKKALAMDPRERWPNCEEFAVQLENICGPAWEKKMQGMCDDMARIFRQGPKKKGNTPVPAKAPQKPPEGLGLAAGEAARKQAEEQQRILEKLRAEKEALRAQKAGGGLPPPVEVPKPAVEKEPDQQERPEESSPQQAKGEESEPSEPVSGASPVVAEPTNNENDDGGDGEETPSADGATVVVSNPKPIIPKKLPPTSPPLVVRTSLPHAPPASTAPLDDDDPGLDEVEAPSLSTLERAALGKPKERSEVRVAPEEDEDEDGDEAILAQARLREMKRRNAYRSLNPDEPGMREQSPSVMERVARANSEFLKKNPQYQMKPHAPAPAVALPMWKVGSPRKDVATGPQTPAGAAPVAPVAAPATVPAPLPVAAPSVPKPASPEGVSVSVPAVANGVSSVHHDGIADIPPASVVDDGPEMDAPAQEGVTVARVSEGGSKVRKQTKVAQHVAEAADKKHYRDIKKLGGAVVGFMLIAFAGIKCFGGDKAPPKPKEAVVVLTEAQKEAAEEARAAPMAMPVVLAPQPPPNQMVGYGPPPQQPPQQAAPPPPQVAAPKVVRPKTVAVAAPAPPKRRRLNSHISVGGDEGAEAAPAASATGMRGLRLNAETLVPIDADVQSDVVIVTKSPMEIAGRNFPSGSQVFCKSQPSGDRLGLLCDTIGGEGTAVAIKAIAYGIDGRIGIKLRRPSSQGGDSASAQAGQNFKNAMGSVVGSTLGAAVGAAVPGVGGPIASAAVNAGTQAGLQATRSVGGGTYRTATPPVTPRTPLVLQFQ